jgi:hypothetical protein
VTIFAVLPDLDAGLVTFLRDHADLATLHGGRVGTQLPAGTGTAIRVANLGGTMPWPWLCRAEFQVECWGGTEAQANQLARTVCAAIYEATGSVTGGWIVTAIVTLAPLWRPDDVSNRPRYITQIQAEATPS